MSYDVTLTIKLPAELVDIAAAVGRALDPDQGGDKSFSLSKDGLTIITSTPCTQEFAAQAAYMLANPDALFAAVSADYAIRWSDLVPPTLEECEVFCGGVIPDPVSTALLKN